MLRGVDSSRVVVIGIIIVIITIIIVGVILCVINHILITVLLYSIITLNTIYLVP